MCPVRPANRHRRFAYRAQEQKLTRRGVANTCWRDFVNIHTISQTQTIAEADFLAAIRRVAEHRAVAIRPLSEVLDGIAEIAQPRWVAWRHKQRLEQTTPELFSTLIGRVYTFGDPILRGTSVPRIWRPQIGEWSSETTVGDPYTLNRPGDGRARVDQSLNRGARSGRCPSRSTGRGRRCRLRSIHRGGSGLSPC